MPTLGVNIDHIATLRQARRGQNPDPLHTLPILRRCKASQVTIHLREDRRHIQDHDLARLIKAKVIPVNLEMALTSEMVSIAKKFRPKICTLVPERRAELTTEGGLDLRKNKARAKKWVSELKKHKIKVSFFIDPDPVQVGLAFELGADAVEFHTGSYAEAFHTKKRNFELNRLKQATHLALALGIAPYAGHGLDTENLPLLVKTVPEIEEYNIGFSIVSNAVFVGLEQAVMEIQEILVP